MSLASWTNLYRLAAVAAAGSAVAIGQPWAFYVAAGIGTMISDPDSMTESAQAWRATDLDSLTQELNDLKDRLKEQGTWEGSAYDTFDEVHSRYLQSVKDLKDNRDATGEAVGQTATIYKWGAVVCSGIAAVMVGLAWSSIAAKASPVSFVISEGVKAAIGKVTLTAIKQVLRKQAMVAGGLTLGLYMAIQASEASGKMFPLLEAIPNQMAGGGITTTFGNDGLQYNEDLGALTPKRDPNGMPPMGQI